MAKPNLIVIILFRSLYNKSASLVVFMSFNTAPMLNNFSVGRSSGQPLLLLMALFWILVWAASSTHAQSSAEANRSINTISQQIDAISKELNSGKKQRKTEQSKLLDAEKSISANQRSLRLLEAKIFEQTKQTSATKEKIVTLQQQSQTIAQKLAVLIRDQYVQGSDAYIKQLLNQENPYALGRLNHYRSIFGDAMLAKIEEHAFLVNGLREQQNAYNGMLEQLAADKRSMSSKQAELLSNKSKRQKVIAALDTQLLDKASQLKWLNEDRERLKALLKQIQLKAEQLAKLSQRPARTTVPGGFLKQSGRLNYPVDGKIKTAFGVRIPTSGIRSNGLYFESKQNAMVSSIYSGTVIFSDYLKGFGELIIVDHGDDHISLYGHNDQLLKNVGDSVAVDEVIAKVGTSGGLKQPGLYFEIRNKTQPVNPNIWLSKR
ncbi:MAG TPA: hypothetical protein DCW52_11020 [Gammaproteobacteria bacterium]|nr:hypothetical protein [Gammaproteobacteria bacterium]